MSCHRFCEYMLHRYISQLAERFILLTSYWNCETVFIGKSFCLCSLFLFELLVTLMIWSYNAKFKVKKRCDTPSILLYMRRMLAKFSYLFTAISVFSNSSSDKYNYFKICDIVMNITIRKSVANVICREEYNIDRIVLSATILYFFERIQQHNVLKWSLHEQICLIRVRFERYFSHYQPRIMGEVSLET